ncbi:hypothetical protein [Soonwooa sp.]|uniref:hypothetical protein n=1 Tax=Soonwooa sp. TaxID=1938592 RepID=UPI0028B17BCC|nr:hypothetical protein [Soonwooa sp.]
MNHELYQEHYKIIEDVLNERKRQNDKFGTARNQHPFLWNTILVEEVGEAAKESLDIYFKTDQLDKDNALKKYRKELIEVAAVAIATIQDLDNNGIY